MWLCGASGGLEIMPGWLNRENLAANEDNARASQYVEMGSLSVPCDPPPLKCPSFKLTPV